MIAVTFIPYTTSQVFSYFDWLKPACVCVRARPCVFPGTESSCALRWVQGLPAVRTASTVETEHRDGSEACDHMLPQDIPNSLEQVPLCFHPRFLVHPGQTAQQGWSRRLLRLEGLVDERIAGT